MEITNDLFEESPLSEPLFSDSPLAGSSLYPSSGAAPSQTPFVPLPDAGLDPIGEDDPLLENAVETVGQVITGFISGFSTIPFGEEPENTVEAIANSIGHLMGFVGVVPGVGSVGSLLAKGVVRGVGLTARGLEAAGVAGKVVKGAAAAEKAVQASRPIRLLSDAGSIPMIVGRAAERRAVKVAEMAGLAEATKFLGKRSGLVADVARGSVFYGAASGISNWSEGVDGVMHAFVTGAAFGVADRYIGNLFPGGGQLRRDIGVLFEGGKPARHMAARALSGSLVNGIPVTMQGAPVELQVYNYLLGAYFGGSEMGRHQRAAVEWMRGVKGEHGSVRGQVMLMRPEEIEGFSALSSEAQAEVRHEGEVTLNRFITEQDNEQLRAFGLGTTSEAELIWGRATRNTLDRLVQEGVWKQKQVDELLAENEGLTADEGRAELAQEAIRTEMARHARIDAGVESPYRVPLEESAEARQRQEILSRADLDVGLLEPIVRPEEAVRQTMEMDWALEEAYRDHEEVYPLQGGLSRASREIAQEMGGEAFGAQIDARQIETELVELASRSLSEKGRASFNDFVDSVERTYLGGPETLDTNTPLWRNLRRSWLSASQGERVLRRVLRVDENRLGLPTERDGSGNRRVEYEPASFLKQRFQELTGLEQPLLVIDQAQANARAKETPLYQSEDPNVVARSIGAAAREGWYVVGGVKDKGRLVATPGLVGERAPDLYSREGRVLEKDAGRVLEAKTRALDAVIDAHNRARADRIPTASEALRNDFESFLDLFPEGRDERAVRDLYTRLTAHGLRTIEMVNGRRRADGTWEVMPIEEIARKSLAGEGSFVADAVAFNKRMQVLEAGEVRARPEAFSDIEDAPAGGLDILLLDDARETVRGLDPLSGWVYDREAGRAVPETFEAHTDGVFFLRDDVFEALASYAGLDPASGAQKGVTLSVGREGAGLLLGKYAYHRAGPEQSEHMREVGAQGLMYTSAAKQYGTRPVVGREVMRDGAVRYSEDPASSFARIGYEELTLNPSSGEDPQHALEDQNLPKQALTNLLAPLVGRDPIDTAFEELIEPSFKGRVAENERARIIETLSEQHREADDATERARLEARMEKEIEALDVEGMGVESLMGVLYGEGMSASLLYSKVLRHVLDIDKSGDLPPSEELLSGERAAQARAQSEYRTAADRIIKSWPTTPATASYKYMPPYVEGVVRRYVMQRVLKPKVEHSWVSALAPYDAFLRARTNNTLGRDIQPGEILLHEGVKNKEIQWGDEKTTLGEAWDQFQEAGGWARAPGWMQKAMEIALIRVPADSVSGIRTVRIAGFTGRAGTGLVAHPKDMEYLGGADLDIDKAFAFQSLPSGMMEAYRAYQDQWERIAQTADGEEVSARIPVKQFDEAFEVDLGADMGPTGMFATAAKLSASRGAYEGNQLLGVGLNAAQRHHLVSSRLIEEGGRFGERAGDERGETFIPARVRREWAERGLLSWRRDDEGNIITNRQGERVAQDAWWTARAAGDNGERLRAFWRDVVNYGADAADYSGLISRTRVADLLGRQAFDDIRVHTVDDEGNIRDIEEVYEEVRTTWSTPYSDLSAIDRYLKGYNYDAGRNYDLDEVFGGLRDVARAFPGLRDVDHTHYRAASLLSGLFRPEPVQTIKDETNGIEQPVPRYLGEQVHEVKRLLDEIIAGEDQTASFFREVALRKAGGLKIFNRTSPADRQQALDYPVNDLTDVTTAALLYRMAKRIPGIEDAQRQPQVVERLQRIANRVVQYRDRAARVRGEVERQDVEQGTYTPNTQAYQQLTSEIRQYWSGLEPPFRRWFEAYLMGSLYPQRVGSQAHQDFVAADRQVKQALREGADQDTIDRVKAARADAAAKWHRTTTASSFALAQDVIGPVVFRRFGELYNRFVQATWRPSITRSELQQLVFERPVGGGRALDEAVEGASTVNAATTIQERSTGFSDRLRRLVRVSGEEGAPGVDDAYAQQLQTRIEKILWHDPKLIPEIEKHIAGLLAQGRQIEKGQDISALTKRDVEAWLSTMERFMAHEGPETIEKKRRRGIPLKPWDWFHWPDAINDKHIPFDRNYIELEAPVISRRDGEIVERMEPVKYVFSHFGMGAEVWKEMNRLGDGLQASAAQQREREERFLKAHGEEGETLQRLAVDIREGSADDAPGILRAKMIDAQKRLASEFSGKRYRVQEPEWETARTMTAKELVDYINDKHTSWARRVYSEYIRSDADDAALAQVGKPRPEQDQEALDDHFLVLDDAGRIDVRETLKNALEVTMTGGQNVRLPGMDVMLATARQMLINDIEVGRPALRGTEASRLIRYFSTAIDPSIGSVNDIRGTEAYRRIQNGDDVQIPPSIRALVEKEIAGPEGARLGRLEEPLRSQVEARMVRRFKNTLSWRETGSVDFAHYWPRNGHPPEILQAVKKQQLSEAKASGKRRDQLTEQEIELELALGRMQAPDGGFATDVARWMEQGRLTISDLENGALQYRPPHLRQRGTVTDGEGPLPGYDKTLQAKGTYENQLIRGRTQLLAALMNHAVIRDFEQRRVMGEYTDEWAVFMKAYNRDNLGYPSLFPQEWQRRLRGKMGPYWFFTDQFWEESARSTSARFPGAQRYLYGKDRAVDERLFTDRLRRFSQLEGQYQLVTLLAHTKSAMQNLFGGSEYSVINAGWRPFSKTFSMNYLRKLEPSWNTRQDVKDFAEQQHAVENYIINEIDLRGWNRIDGMQEFMDDFMAQRRENPDLPDTELVEIARKHGVWNTLRRLSGPAVQIGALPMRLTERELRQRSWLAHYIKARETLNMAGDVFEMDHPWLIRMANKGVEATQFLYNNSARPAFARTAVGRVFSRFQLWAWNSVRWRRNVLREAGRQNLDPQSDAGQRLRRMMTADLFVIGLAGLLPFSLFGSSVPPPLNWMVELSSYLFGDEEEKSRAFFGSPLGPLQIVTPPVMRFPIDAFEIMLDDRAQRFAGSRIVTWFPFGRMAKDVYKAADSPITASERLLGFPLINLHQVSREIQEEGRLERRDIE